MTLSAYLPPLFAATIVVGLLMAFWLLWVLFLAVMHLNDAKRAGTLRGFALYAGYTVLAMGLLVDFVVQMTAATILWLEWPRELTVSGPRHAAIGVGRGLPVQGGPVVSAHAAFAI